MSVLFWNALDEEMEASRLGLSRHLHEPFQYSVLQMWKYIQNSSPVSQRDNCLSTKYELMEAVSKNSSLSLNVKKKQKKDHCYSDWGGADNF